MSMQTDCIYGVGFFISASDENLVSFALKHRKTVERLGSDFRRLLAYIDEGHTNIKADFYDLGCSVTGHEGAYALVSSVMSEESDVRFGYYPGELQDDAIVFEQMMPWQFTEREKSLTSEELKSIIRSYMEEIWSMIDPVLEDWIRLEYFG